MKTRVALLAVVLAVVAVTLLLVFIRRPAPRPQVASPPPAPRPIAPQASTPEAVVVAYLEALQREDFATAYELLSGGSQEAHPYEEFVSQCEQGGATSYDLSAALEAVMTEPDHRATVTIPLVEDPAEATFTAVREEGGWRVVYIGGAPWFPYP
jgi:hypothetical protein